MEPDSKLTKFDWVNTKGESSREMYGNYVHTTWTRYDVRFQVGQIVPKDGDPSAGFVIENRGAVTIGWAQAKELHEVLTGLIAAYERANGEIREIKMPQDEPKEPDLKSARPN